MLIVICVAGVVNIRGVRGGARLVEASAALKLVPLVGFVVVGAFLVDPARLAWPAVPPLSSVLNTAGIIILAFMGIEGALQPSGEVRHPERTVPRAAFLAIGGVVLLYIGIQLVAQGLAGAALAGDRSTPLATAAGMALGTPGRTIMLAGATASMFGFLCGSVLAGPRSIFAFGRDGFLPAAFAAVHPTRRTPHVAIVAYVVIALALGLSGTFEQLAVFTNVAGLLVYIAVAISSWVLRVRDVRLAARPFSAPGGPLVPVLACLCIAAVIYATVSRIEVLALGAALLISSGVYLVRAIRLDT
jgi:amino acid transporter